MAKAEPRWHEFESAAALAEALADAVAARLGDAIDGRGAALLAVSGGTTPGAFLRALSRRKLDWSAVTVTLVDERCVPTASTRSNARLVAQNLLQNDAARAEFVGLHDDAGSPERSAEKASEAISALPLPLDVAVLGMGTDGHTASFFPDADDIGPLLAAEDGPAVLPISAPSAGEPRLTLSVPVIAAARHVALHIEGAAKKQVLEDALGAEDGAAPPIAAVMRRTAKPVHIYWAPKEDRKP